MKNQWKETAPISPVWTMMKIHMNMNAFLKSIWNILTRCYDWYNVKNEVNWNNEMFRDALKWIKKKLDDLNKCHSTGN